MSAIAALPYQASLQWNSGEREAFEAWLFEDDFSFYVPDAKLADYRERAATMSPKEWKAIFKEEGYVAHVGIAYGPKDLALAYLAGQAAKYPDCYSPMGGALARFGSDAVPVLLDQVSRHPTRALDDLAPVDAAELALPVARILASEESSKSKAKAQAWLLRHPRAATAGLVLAAARRKGDPAATAALARLAENGHVAVVRAIVQELASDCGARIEELIAPAIRKASRKGAATAAQPPSHTYLGWVYYKTHHCSPLMIGDFEVMKDWKGNPDGSDELAHVTLPKGTVVAANLDLQAPDVFASTSRREVVLLAKRGSGGSLQKEHTDDELQKELVAPLVKTFGTLPLTISSGALVITIAYNATPQEGADVRDLNELCFFDKTPRLPKQVPATPLYKSELVVVPIPNGTYEIVDGQTKTMMKCVIRPIATKSSPKTSRAPSKAARAPVKVGKKAASVKKKR